MMENLGRPCWLFRSLHPPVEVASVSPPFCHDTNTNTSSMPCLALLLSFCSASSCIQHDVAASSLTHLQGHLDVFVVVHTDAIAILVNVFQLEVARV